MHRRMSQGAGGAAAPQTRAKAIIFPAKAKFFGQNLTAKK